MKIIEKFISPLVEAQFPDFYKEQGPLFILFVEEYYRWLESNVTDYSTYNDAVVEGNANYHIRRLFEYRDIDQTLDNFLIYFKEKYLKNIQAETNISQRRLIKAAQDIFTSKGSERSFDLLFKLVFGTKVEIYRPGDYVLKPSDGTWVNPEYLELTQSQKNPMLPGKMVTGSISNSTAFVEYVITRNINGKLIDIAFISDVTGVFVTGEAILLADGLIENAPKVIGSLSTIDITVSGELFSVGEIVKIYSARGVEGQARVSEIDETTGIVRFQIIDGGWGYSNNAETYVSSKVWSVSNLSNSNTQITEFDRFEQVTQNNYSFNLTDVTGVISKSANIINGNTSSPSLSLCLNVDQNVSTSNIGSNTANIVLNQLSGNVFSNSIIYDKNKAIVSTYVPVGGLISVGDQVTQRSFGANNVTGIVQSVSNVVIMEVNIFTINSNGIHVGTYLKQQGTGAEGQVLTIPRENLFTFTNVSHITVKTVTGSFNNTNIINVYSNSSLTTLIGTFSISTGSNGIFNGVQYELINTNLNTDTRWSFANSLIKTGSPLVNSTIIVASDVGGLVSTYSDLSATANVIGSNSTAIGVINVNGSFYSDGAKITGGSSNTFAFINNIYSGQGADFSVGVLDNIEVVRVSPDLINSNNDGPGSNSVKFSSMLISGANSTFGNLNSVYIESPGVGYDNTNVVIFTGGNTGVGSYQAGNASIVTDSSGVILSVTLTSNVGNGIVSTPTASIVNSSGGSSGVGTGASLLPVSSLGFVKLPGGDITFPLLDLLRFNTLTIGSIASLSNINPGEQYNVNPFVLAYERDIASYGKKDIIIDISGVTGPGFIDNEYVEQTINTPGIEIVANNYSGNTANNFEVSEFVYATDGISNTGSGLVYSTTYDAGSNSYTIVITSNTGTFGIGDQLIGSTTNSTVDIISTSPYTASTLARAVVKTNANNQTLGLKRISLFTEFIPGNIVTGKTSGTTATVTGTAVDASSKTIGDNATILANVISSSGAIGALEVVSSGFGYEQDETVSILSEDGSRAATGKANVTRHGIGLGYYSSSRGFLNDGFYLFDGDYYQNYSYEIRTGIPLEKYTQILKDLLHIAGKKFFGRVQFQTDINTNIEISSTIANT